MIFEQIQNPRYDYNYISEKYLRDFKYNLKRASVINEKTTYNSINSFVNWFYFNYPDIFLLSKFR